MARRQNNLHAGCQYFLKVSEGITMISWVLILVAVATFSTLYQMATSENDALIHMEFIISMYFLAEILTKLLAFTVVDGDIDNFVFNKMNMLDFVVVVLDMLLLVAEGEGGEGGPGGLLKSLRSLRVLRLVRLSRGMRAVNLMNMMNNSDQDQKIREAKADTRSVTINFDMISKRFLVYIKRNAGLEMEESKKQTLQRSLTILVKYFTKYRERVEVKEDDRSDEEKGDANDKRGIILWEEELKKRQDDLKAKQISFKNNNAASIITEVIGNTVSREVLRSTFELGKELLSGGNKEVQSEFLDILKNKDADGIFFGVVRKTLREAAQALKNYRLSKVTGNKIIVPKNGGEIVDQHIKSQIEEMHKSMSALGFLTQLCEGHNLDSKNLLREQEKSVQSFNIVEDVCDLLGLQANSLQVAREFDDTQAEITIASLEFLVEVCQGPCAVNQALVCSNGKAIGVCKNLLSCNFKNKIDPILKYNLYTQSVILIAALLENREDSFTHKYLQGQIPQKMLEQRMNAIEKIKHELKKGEDLVRKRERGGRA